MLHLKRLEFILRACGERYWGGGFSMVLLIKSALAYYY